MIVVANDVMTNDLLTALSYSLSIFNFLIVLAMILIFTASVGLSAASSKNKYLAVLVRHYPLISIVRVFDALLDDDLLFNGNYYYCLQKYGLEYDFFKFFNLDFNIIK